MKKSLGLVLLLSTLQFGTARAVESINVQTFNPSTSNHFVFLEDAFKAEFPNPGKLFFQANYNYVNQPLVATDIGQTTQVSTIINSIQTMDMAVGFRATSAFGIFFGLPIHYITYPDTAATGYPTGTNTALGDMKILGKIRLTTDESNTAICLIPEFHLPTGSTENFVSDASTYIAGRLTIEHAFDNFTFVGNAGYVSASNARYTPANTTGIDYTKRFTFGVGGFIPVNDAFGFNVEYTSTHLIPLDKNLNPNELYGGIRFNSAEAIALTAGASVGKIAGPAGSNFRVVLGLRYTLFEEASQKKKAKYND